MNIEQTQVKHRMEILRFTPDVTEQVIDLVVGIQRGEFGVSITAADQPDLLDIASFFQSGRGNFWAAKSGPRIVGTIGLLDVGGDFGVIRKMFVAPDFRGKEHGTAQHLLDTACRWALDLGFSALYLGTIDRYHAAIRFYERNGFSEIPAEELPAAFPRMAVDNRFFRKPL